MILYHRVNACDRATPQMPQAVHDSMTAAMIVVPTDKQGSHVQCVANTAGVAAARARAAPAARGHTRGQQAGVAAVFTPVVVRLGNAFDT